MAVGEHAVAEDVALVGDVVGADHLQRVGGDQGVEVVPVTAGPQCRDDLVVAGRVLIADNLIPIVDSVAEGQAAPPTGGRSVIFPSRHKNPWKFR